MYNNCMKFERLSDFAINNHYNNNHRYGGCYAKDTFAKTADPTDALFYIINMCDENDKEGTHWVFVYNAKPKYCIYFDSFGQVGPPTDILQWMKRTNKICVSSSAQIQDLSSYMCGYYCVYIIDHLARNKPYVDIIMDGFTPDPLKNEQIIRGYFIRNQKKYFNLLQ